MCERDLSLTELQLAKGYFMVKPSFLSMSALMLIAPLLVAQQRLNSPPQKGPMVLGHNSRRMISKLELDRQEYLAGELFKLTITVTNPTPDALEIYDPFHGSTSGIDLMRLANSKDDKELAGQYIFVSPHPSVGWQDLPGPTIVLQPGQTRRYAVESRERIFGGGLSWSGPGAPGKPASTGYRLRSIAESA